ncbi:ribonucleotide reductase [Protofrankia symbiont of Coriaria ruscifolia]|uniref:TSCPD domain-containing protein n=1 Tax=Protofrankia symbiont of Coriaria ruscifolia TaxID=1306542 RepID=UPI001F5FB89D|nr:ribonucleotide reductase [Protofrankia symbiont of Coriaria ruscifolia]
MVDATSAMGTRPPGGVARRAPRRRESVTRSFTVGGAYGFIIASLHADGSLADVNLIMAKQGSTLRGMTETVSLAISTGLAHGVPLVTFVRQFTDLRFEPAGLTDDAEIPQATSIIDYVVRRLALDFLPLAERAALGVLTPSERAEVATGSTPVPPVWSDTPGMPRFVPFEIPVQVAH